MNENVTFHTETIITIENYWTEEKCDDYIALSEGIGYSEALVQTDLGPRRLSNIHNNQRVFYDNQELADEIWNQLNEIAPKKVGNSISTGINERFRFYKYENNQSFKRHRDQSYIRNEFECSYFTFMIYLNDNFEGGATIFNDIKIVPKKGMSLLFYHPLEHEGEMVVEGVKYILRSDIMYKFNT